MKEERIHTWDTNMIIIGIQSLARLAMRERIHTWETNMIRIGNRGRMLT